MHWPLRVLAFVLGCMLAAVSLANPPHYSYRVLSPPGGVQIYDANGLNDSGQALYTTIGGGHVYLDGGVPVLIADSNGAMAFGRNVDNGGEVAGDATGGIALAWLGGSIHLMPSLPGEQSYSTFAVDAGRVVVLSYNPTTNVTRPLLYDGSLHTIPISFSSYNYLDLRALKGSYGVGSGYVGASSFPVYYNGSQIQPLSVPVGDFGTASSLNTVGKAVGALSYSGNYHVATWDLTNGGVESEIPQPPSYSLFGSDINDAGQIVASGYNGSHYIGALIDNNQIYDLNSLTTLPAGWSIAGAMNINNSGQILCYAGTTSGTAYMVLNPIGLNQTRYTLRKLVPPAGSFIYDAAGINDTGQVIYSTIFSNPNHSVGVIDTNGSVQLLQGGNGVLTYPKQIDNNGNVAGSSSTSTALAWINGVIQTIPPYPGLISFDTQAIDSGNMMIAAYDPLTNNSYLILDNAGSQQVVSVPPGLVGAFAFRLKGLTAVGYAQTSYFVPMLYRGATGIQLPGLYNQPYGEAISLNNNSQAVGFSLTPSNGYAATEWDLNTLAPTIIGSGQANGINDAGLAVGTDYLGNGVPVVYSGGVGINLNSLTDGMSPDTVMDGARDINNSGQILVYGTDSSGYFYGVLTPEHPGITVNVSQRLNLGPITDGTVVKVQNNDGTALTPPQASVTVGGTVTFATLPPPTSPNTSYRVVVSPPTGAKGRALTQTNLGPGATLNLYYTAVKTYICQSLTTAPPVGWASVTLGGFASTTATTGYTPALYLPDGSYSYRIFMSPGVPASGSITLGATSSSNLTTTSGYATLHLKLTRIYMTARRTDGSTYIPTTGTWSITPGSVSAPVTGQAISPAWWLPNATFTGTLSGAGLNGNSSFQVGTPTASGLRVVTVN